MLQLNALLMVIINTVVPIFIIITLAMLLGRWKPLNVQTLSRVSIYLFSPALILTNISQTNLNGRELGGLLFGSLTVCTLMAIIGALIARGLRYERKLASTFTLTALIMNSVNFGLPYIEFAFGPEGLEPAVVFIVGQAVIAYLIGTYVASRGESSIKTAVRNALTIPAPYAFLVAFGINWSGVIIPEPVARAANVLGQGIVPATLVILGLQLGSAKIRGRWRPIAVATFTRFVIGAAVAFGVAGLFGLEGLSRQVFIMEASMPAGILSGVLSTEFGGDPEFAAATILVTTIASAFFLSVLLLLVRGG